VVNLSFTFEDPRVEYIRGKLARLKGVLVFVSGKGGVGKSTIATLTSLSLLSRGFKVGLVDMDLTNPTIHVILGLSLSEMKVVEDRGVKPVNIHGVNLFSPIMFIGENPLPLRGSSIVNALRELLAISNLDGVEMLLVDMPPSTKEEVLEIIRYDVEPVVVTSQDPLGLWSAKRLLRLLKDEGVGNLGVVENMAMKRDAILGDYVRSLGYTHLGVIPFDQEFHKTIGDVEGILASKLYGNIHSITDNIINFLGV
jgi:ATP-binding protein involved in chromosome partitioning